MLEEAIHFFENELQLGLDAFRDTTVFGLGELAGKVENAVVFYYGAVVAFRSWDVFVLDYFHWMFFL
jgi:hypothetical protein